MCTGCTDYRYWHLMTGTLCWSVTIWSGRSQGEEGLTYITSLIDKFICIVPINSIKPSVLWHCWLGGRKGIRPVKNWVAGAGMVICLEQGADLHMVQLIPLPLTVSCSSKIQIGFTFLVPTHPGSPGQKVVKWVCVCACKFNRVTKCFGRQTNEISEINWRSR